MDAKFVTNAVIRDTFSRNAAFVQRKISFLFLATKQQLPNLLTLQQVVLHVAINETKKNFTSNKAIIKLQ